MNFYSNREAGFTHLLLLLFWFFIFLLIKILITLSETQL
jgi:hypothetical protein